MLFPVQEASYAWVKVTSKIAAGNTVKKTRGGGEI
jgi:hypothetical protein